MRVQIYQRPFTMEEPEGPATLVRWLNTDPETGAERWLVRFDDGDEAERVILAIQREALNA